MKIAIVHDFLCNIGGSERVFSYMCEAFPEADAFTLAYHPEKTFPVFKKRRIQTTWLQKWIRTPELFRWNFLLNSYVMKTLDFSSYDLVISSSASTAKYLRAPFHICYCYIPTRALWHFDQYFGNGLKAKLLKTLLPYLKKRDYENAQTIDRFIAISQSSKDYIRKYYNRDSEIIFSPIDMSHFVFSEEKKDHYLTVSRLEKWKGLEYCIEAFNELGLSLKVIGKGSEEKALKAMAKSNIEFLGEVDDAALAKEYSEAKAVIFTPFLEYGLIPLEANASGTPVIAYGHGGIEETMIPNQTACFFDEQTKESLIEGVKQFEKMSFDPHFLRKHAEKWDKSHFIKAIQEKALQLHNSK